MAGTIVAVFSDKMEAEKAAEALLGAGVPFNDIGLVHKNAGGEAGSPMMDGQMPEELEEEYLTHAVREVRSHDVEEPIDPRRNLLPLIYVGGFIGAVVGMMIVTISVYFEPMRLRIQANPLEMLMIGTTIGAIIGGMIAARAAGDMPDSEKHVYHDHVERGNTLITVISSRSNAAKLEEILGQHGGQEMGFFPRVIDTLQSIES
jgi:hypothetical protein